MESPENPGNFLSLLWLLAVHDEELRRHLETPAMRCATYLSPQTQNEPIKVMGNHILLQKIIGDLTAAPYYAILADEVTSHNVEHLAIRARFVDRSTKEVREEFSRFLKLDRITGERIADGIFGFLEENNIPLATMRGQGYDGASYMSSDRVGVQARIIIDHIVVNEERRKALIDLCKTRWAERHSAYRHFYQEYVFVVEALEMIAFPLSLGEIWGFVC